MAAVQSEDPVETSVNTRRVNSSLSKSKSSKRDDGLLILWILDDVSNEAQRLARTN